MIKREVKEEFDSTLKLVAEVLAEDQRSRNSDLWLILQVWQKKQHIKLFLDYNQLDKMISPETIRRTRQLLNSQGKFLSTNPQILIKRKVRADLVKEYFAENKWLVQQYERLKWGIK